MIRGSERLSKGLLTYGIATAVAQGGGLLLLPVYARHLSTEEFGTVALAETIGAAIASVFGLGLPASVTRFYAKLEVDPESQRAFVATVVKTSLFLACTGSVLVGIVAGLTEMLVGPLAFAMASASALSGMALQTVLYLYQARQLSLQYAALSVLKFAATNALALGFVVASRLGAEGLLGGRLGGTTLVLAASLWMAREHLRAHVDGPHLRAALRFCLPLVPHGLVSLTLSLGDRLMLDWLGDTGMVGVYSLGYTFGSVGALFTTVVMLAWTPIYYRLTAERAPAAVLGLRTSGLVLLMASVAVVVVLVGPPLVVWVTSQEYAGAGSILPHVAVGVFLHGIFSLFHLPLLYRGRTTLVAASTALAAVVNVLVNLLMIPILGGEGAAIATVLAYAVQAAVVLVLAVRSGDIEAPSVVLCVGIAAPLVAHIGAQVVAPPVATVVVVAVGFALACSALWIRMQIAREHRK